MSSLSTGQVVLMIWIMTENLFLMGEVTNKPLGLERDNKDLNKKILITTLL